MDRGTDTGTDPFAIPQLDIVPARDDAAILLHPMRLRLLEAFREPSSAAEVARRIDQPRQRIGHHVRELESAGFLVPAGERRRGNFVEKLLRASARAYVLSPDVLGPLAPDPATLQDRFSSAYLLATAARTLREVGGLRQRAARAEKRLATLTLEAEVRFSGPDAQSDFARELTECLQRLTAKYHDEDAPSGRRFRFTVAGHPAVSSPASSTDSTTHDTEPDTEEIS